ncbi:hypothetical protein ACQ4LE_002674 [Meloidogyne hapla]|uniref:RNA-binding protein 19 n=1 Tax=Meloidogyne hapla TaxID=6305 RepID=A0A1I8BSP2_MELHA
MISSSAETSTDNLECSRLFVKNLSGGKKKGWNEQKLRQLFEKYGAITDVKLKINDKSGTIKFAFVGFEDSASCKAAFDKLNGTFLKGKKLEIDLCKPLPDERKQLTREFTLRKISKKGCDGQTIDKEIPKPESSVDTLIEEKIMDTGRLFLRNLPFSCTEEKLKALLEPFGTLAEINLIVTKDGQCKGYALCSFMFPEHALEAWKKLDGQIFMGRMLHIIAGEENTKKPVQLGAKTLSKFQTERESSRRGENAEKLKQTWNSLFLGTNAVADLVAEDYQVTKRELLLEGKGENSAAVRLSMAETRLVRETRKFLLDNGVKLDAFSNDNSTTKRSKTVILVKNLNGKPGGSEELNRIFSRHGEIKNVIMPPDHGISALVEMTNELDAKKAFETLSYSKRFSITDGRPLYLEWAPIDVFDETHEARQRMANNFENNEEDYEESSSATNQKKDEEKKDRTKILVRNVPFQADPKEISQLFSAFGELKFVRIPKKPGGEGRGFCFVDFISPADAKRAMETLMHSTHLYGRRLVLEWAKMEENVEELRDKIKRKNLLIKGNGIKKTKMRTFAS